MSKAVYVFPADVLTYAYIDIVKGLSGLYDEVILGIENNPKEKYIFTAEERAYMAQKSLFDVSNIDIVSLQGSPVDYAHENKIPVIVRGIIDSRDCNCEAMAHQTEEADRWGIKTFFTYPKHDSFYKSSDSVKEMQETNRLVHEYVPPCVKAPLEQKMSGQCIIAITGEAGVGKSHVGRKFEELGKEKDILVNNIDLDATGHYILGNSHEPLYQQVRDKVAAAFEKVRMPDGGIDRTALGEIVFKDYRELEKLNKIMYEPIMFKARRDIYQMKGLIILNAALIAESNMTPICSNHVVLVTADKKSQNRRLVARNFTPEQIKKRLGSQYTSEAKRAKIEERIQKDNYGKLWTIDNSDNSNPANIANVFENIIAELNVR